MNGRKGLLVGIVVLLLFVAGCGGARVAQPASPASSRPASEVRLAAGDAVEVKFFNVAELNESQVIRPDGKISLQLVGEVEAQGRTPAQLRDELNRLYAPHLKAADVTVIVRSFQSRRVYVGGEVVAPGVVNMPGPLTAMQAIMEAGGFTRFARLENVVIIRHADGKRYGASLDFKPSKKEAPAPEPFYLEPLDIVFVPETRITRVNRWIDQHINQILPTFGVVYTWKPTADATVEIDTTRFRTIK
jgi:protein involved in polysaccharide export with SLBB domain